MKKRFIAFILCISITLGLIPFGGVVAVSTEAAANGFVNYGANIGNTAIFNEYDPIPISDNPQGVNNPWGTDCEFLSGNELSKNLLMVITDYYCSENGYLWYKVDGAPGYELPEKLQINPWVYQDDVNMPMGESLVIHNTGKNFVFDNEGNPVSTIAMSAYDEVDLTCATSLQGKVDYQWQIYIDNEWVDIDGENQSTITVTAGILLNAFQDDLNAEIRCTTKTGSKSVVGESIHIAMELYSPAEMFSLRSAASDALSIVADDEDEYRYVTVRYLFQNGAEAANPFVAKVLKDEALNVTVDFPTVQGYLPYYQDVQQGSLTVDEIVTDNITYTVYYLPTDVEYYVDVYFQNIEDDDYTFQSTETLSGLTGSKVPHTTVSYEGMYELLHETPTIAANGSTRIEVYFNRVYYLTHFELDGGYGVYSIYARYGSELADSVGTPIRPGYTFVGWDDISSGTVDGIADVMPDTVPAKEQSFKAIWKENPTAEVRIAFWGENPNDEGYSYIESQTLEVKPGTVLTYGDGGYICGLREHTHGSGCTYMCGFTEHTHGESCYKLSCNRYHIHSEGCYNCEEEGHTHSLSCYSGVYGNAFSGGIGEWGVSGTKTDGSIGESYGFSGGNKYIYLFGTWYKYTGNVATGGTQLPVCGKEETTHNHTDACLGCGKEEHSHSDYTGSCYTLTCTIDEHTHTAVCTSCVQHQHSNSCRINEFSGYDSSKWTLVKSDTVTVAANGSTVMNVYFDRTAFTMTFKKEGSGGTTLGTITDKWGADIRERFKSISEANTFFWSEKQNGGSPWTSFMDVMPAKNMTFYADPQSGSTTLTATYYGQKLGSSEYEELYAVTFKGSSSITVSKEEFVEIEGYEFNDSKSSDIGDRYNGAVFYYDRASFRLEFYNGTALAREEAMLYEESFSKFSDYIPDLPSEFEPGSRRFVGWYLNPECTGEKVNLSKMKMPAENMALYAKWELVTHQVNIYKEKFDDGTFGEPVLPGGIQPDPVLHGNKVFETDFTLPIPENKPYSFVGWFYMDGDAERMWDFEHSVVVKDTNIYAKWSAEVLVPYTVRFIVQNEDGTAIEIADTISSSALAGTTVTFDAKGGTELYSGYQTGYFPITTSHSLTMDVNKADEGMTYDFVYVAKDKVPYTVRYVDENGTDLIDPKVVNDNTYAIVTEKFVYIPDYSPDKYQKTLVLNGSDSATNEIVFYYKKDTTQGVYNVTHYIRSTDGVNYIEHNSYGDIGTVNDVIKIRPLELKGFTYDYSVVNGQTTELTDGTVNGTISNEGLEIKLYYERNRYPYKIQYLDKDTLTVLKAPDIITEGEYYGTVVTVSAPPSIENYKLSSVSSSVITEDDSMNPVKNVVNVYYAEQTVRINYEVVGPTGCGTVSPEYTDVKVLSGTGATSTAAAKDGYRFVGWYSDCDCTQQITSSPSLYLTIPDDNVWKAATYYAKFEPQVSDLTIVRKNTIDNTQVYVYEVKNNTTCEIIYVSIVGNGQVTIHDLLMGEYTVTQLNDWSWRYSDSSVSINHQSVDGTTVKFDKGTDTDQWLNGNSDRVKNQRG